MTLAKTPPVKRDGNGKVLLRGIEPLTTDFLVKQGHRWTTCPDYIGISVFTGVPMASMMTMSQPVNIAVAAMACSCGVIVKVELT